MSYVQPLGIYDAEEKEEGDDEDDDDDARSEEVSDVSNGGSW